MAIDLTPPDSLLQIRYNTALGNRLRERFGFSARRADLDEAVEELPDEPVSLSTGFLEAGADAVIASLWPVPDASTRELMTRFYSLWLDGKLHPAEALRRAQQNVRDSTLAEKELFASKTRMPRVRSVRDIIAGRRAQDTADRDRPFADQRFWAAFTFMGAA
jgi:CHAT domain-containing protein